MQAEAAARSEKSAEAFRSIGEAAGELGLPTHVLRFWETKFRQLAPVKRSDGRRFYRPDDMSALHAIRMLVHERGMTIKGAQALLNEQGVAAVLAGEARVTPTLRAVATSEPEASSAVETVVQPVVPPVAVRAAPSPARALQDTVRAAFGAEDAEDAGLSPASRARLNAVLEDLSDVKRRLDAVRLRRAA
jgi:DNA-binding transcriptional MerR regulator